MRRVLVANRGEIALRIMRGCREEEMETVAVYSDADRHAPHVRMADAAVHIGGSAPAESYLRIEKLIWAAKQMGADAIHPGYGFLSERSEFADAVAKAGLIFLGPPAAAINAMGDKTSARRRMREAGVPVVPGAVDPLADAAEAAKVAKTIGYPVLLKAAAGGGGRGMRIVRKPEELESAFLAATGEAEKAFGDGRVYLEKFLEGPRHVEIQILADTHGRVVHLGERECSIQRRHQKLIEESPSPAVTPAIRTAMGGAAVRAAQAVGYVSAGTCEFMLMPDGTFYFLEMNTRLQVEHPVTELVYGVDIVRMQLKIAQGHHLSLPEKALTPRGWALWSQKLNASQPAGGPAGELTKSGAYAYYVQGDRRLAALVLQRAEAGKIKLKFEELPTGMLQSMQREFFNSDNTGAALVDVQHLPRLDGAKEIAERSSSDRLVYSVSGSLANTVAAVKMRLGADGWKPYVAPLENVHSTSVTFKNGRQGLSVHFTIQVGKNERTSEVTTVYYSPTRLNFALAIPSDATDIVFDENRPYLNLLTAGTVDATLEFFRKELGAMGWSPLSAAVAAAHWPNAKLDEKIANGTIAYFIRGTQRPIVLTLQRGDGGKTNAEIKVPPFARPQSLEAGQETFGLPKPKLIKTAGGTGGSTEHVMTATVPVEVGTVLAFYRRELTARHWKEETQGAVVTPQQVTLNYTAPEGPAVLKIGHKYDLTTVSLKLHLPKPVGCARPPPVRRPARKPRKRRRKLPNRRCACWRKTRRRSPCRITRKTSNSTAPTASSSSTARLAPRRSPTSIARL